MQGAQVVGTGQRRVDVRQAQRLGVDVHRQHLGLRPCQRGENRPGAGAAADVHRAADHPGVLVQMAADGVGETVGIRAEEHRVAGGGGKCRVQEQLAVEARQPHLRTPARAAGFQDLRLIHQAEQRARQQLVLEGPAPAEHPVQVVGQRILRPLVDPFVGQRGGRDEVIAAIAQGLAQMQQCAVLRSVHGHGAFLDRSFQLNRPSNSRVASRPAAL